jgi:putative tricarboxylic transport membrane protein
MLTKNPSTLLGSLLVLFSAGVLYLVSRFSEAAETFRSLSPRFFPEYMGYALLLFGSVIFLQGVRRPRAPVFEVRPSRKSVLQAVSFTMLVGALLYFLPIAGFVVSSCLFMILAQLLLEEKRVLVNLLRTGTFVFAMHYLFSTLLRVPLPRGPWGF